MPINPSQFTDTTGNHHIVPKNLLNKLISGLLNLSASPNPKFLKENTPTIIIKIIIKLFTQTGSTTVKPGIKIHPKEDPLIVAKMNKKLMGKAVSTPSIFINLDSLP